MILLSAMVHSAAPVLSGFIHGLIRAKLITVLWRVKFTLAARLIQ